MLFRAGRSRDADRATGYANPRAGCYTNPMTLKIGRGATAPPFLVMDVIAAANARQAALAPGASRVIRMVSRDIFAEPASRNSGTCQRL